MHRIQEILIRDRLKFRFGLSKINVSGEKVSKLIDRTMYYYFKCCFYFQKPFFSFGIKITNFKSRITIL